MEAIAVTGDEKSKDKLMKLRNLGIKSADEILLMIMCHQFLTLPEKERGQFVQQIIEVNSVA